jgi:hypothetical protein
VGKTTFRPEAADAAIAFGADVLLFTEFFPRAHEDQFRAKLSNAGWNQQMMSVEPNEVANRVLIASRLALAPLALELPSFDQQFPANLLGARLPDVGLSVLGIRVPAYEGQTSHLFLSAWNWIEATAAILKSSPSVLLGDLNVSPSSSASRGGDHFRRILNDGWRSVSHASGPTYFGSGGQQTQIDHILTTAHCSVSDPACFRSAGGFSLCGESDAISDHAALACTISVSSGEA